MHKSRKNFDGPRSSLPRESVPLSMHGCMSSMTIKQYTFCACPCTAAHFCGASTDIGWFEEPKAWCWGHRGRTEAAVDLGGRWLAVPTKGYRRRSTILSTTLYVLVPKYFGNHTSYLFYYVWSYLMSSRIRRKFNSSGEDSLDRRGTGGCRRANDELLSRLG
jgi:hypothetical protein